MNERREHLKEHELDIVGSCFGLRFVEGGSPEGLFEIYIEDDDNWIYKLTANHLWLNDLKNVVADAMKENVK